MDIFWHLHIVEGDRRVTATGCTVQLDNFADADADAATDADADADADADSGDGNLPPHKQCTIHMPSLSSHSL